MSETPFMVQNSLKVENDEENFLSNCVKLIFRELFPRMDIQLTPEIAIQLYYILNTSLSLELRSYGESERAHE